MDLAAKAIGLAPPRRCSAAQNGPLAISIGDVASADDTVAVSLAFQWREQSQEWTGMWKRLPLKAVFQCELAGNGLGRRRSAMPPEKPQKCGRP